MVYAQVDHVECPRNLYIMGHFRIMMRLDPKLRQTEAFSQVQNLMKNILKSQLKVEDFDGYLDSVEKEISEANYVESELKRIKNDNSKLIDVLTENSKMCKHDSFFFYCGKVARIFAPVLHLNFQFGGSNLHKFVKPILAEFEKGHLSVIQKKQFSRVVPDILQAFSTAVCNYKKDVALKKSVKELLKGCTEKLAVEDLRPMLNLILEPMPCSPVDHETLQDDLFEVGQSFFLNYFYRKPYFRSFPSCWAIRIMRSMV